MSGKDPALITRVHSSLARRAAAIFIASTVLVGIGTAAFTLRYHRAPWTTYPSTLHLCGRDFQPAPDGPQPLAKIESAGYHLVRFGHTPGFIGSSPVWTWDLVAGRQTEVLAGGCHVGMWVQGGSNAFQGYDLEGGP